jgi:type I restriction enzyme S subunit
MIADLKPYAEYKESGSRWLGAVPVTWGVQNLRTLISKRTERDRADLPLLSVARERGVFVRSLTDADENHNVIPDDLSNYKVARAGNLVINKMKAWQGSMGIAPCDGIVSPAYFVFDFRIANHAFGQRLLRSKPYVAHFGQASDGVRVGQWDLSIPGMRQIPVLLPPPEEQSAIVRFLDWANGRLDRAIRAKRKVISLLNEQKQAIIHRAVTRGLDPSVPLKPSGIPWLGDIPAHWEVRRLRHLIKGRLTYGANAAAEFTNPDWPRYIRITDFRTDGSLKPDTFRSLPPHVASDYMVSPGDILFARSGATVGKAFLVLTLTGAACHAGYLIRARPDRSLVHPHYLFAFTQTRAFSAWKDSTFNTATIQNIGADKYANLPVPLPSLIEQQAVLESVTVEQRPINATVSRLEREIDLLREYRTRLVADVVTGKLDVREAASKIPDEEPLLDSADTEDIDIADDLNSDEEADA